MPIKYDYIFVGDVYVSRDKRTKREPLTARKLIPNDGLPNSGKIQLTTKHGRMRYICPFRLTSGKADCYELILRGTGATLWQRKT